MIQHTVAIKHIKFINHDTLHLKTEKPKDYSYVPGQATHVRIDAEDVRDERGAFTFTNLPAADHLEFTIKTYPSHNGMTDKLRDLKVGDHLLLEEVYGAIKYKGKGVFIAGGAGVTPFVSILKSLEDKDELDGHKLLFSNKSEKDILMKGTFEAMLGENFVNILSEEKAENYAHGHIDKEFLKKHIDDWSQYFYVCGPPKMIESVENDLYDLGVKEDQIVKEDLG
ncbi:MAG: FAD-binding oxidoreductase [Leeuwenhoekiella sp.]